MTATLPTARATRKDAVENREAILVAAAVVFRREPEASLDAVATEAGLSRRSIYGHFASRDELLAELMVRGGARISAALADVHDDDPRTHLALIGAALWTEVQQVRVLAQLAIHGPLEQTIAEALVPVRASVRVAARGGVEAGWFRSDLPVESLARLIEDAAIAVLDEAVRADLSEAEGRRLVMAMGLSVAGLSWREADAVIRELPGAAGAAGAASSASRSSTSPASTPSPASASADSSTSTSPVSSDSPEKSRS